MSKKKYDTLVIGHVSLDEEIYEGKTSNSYGGAVLYSGYSAVAGGNKVGIVTKAKKEDEEDISHLFNAPAEDVYYKISKDRTSIRNEYLTADREQRISSIISVADSFSVEDIPQVDSSIYHLAGLIVGDYNDDMIERLSQRGKVAVDVQGYLRRNIDGEMIYHDWEQKEKYLPYIDFLKTDALEAEILTGETDRKKAAKMLYDLGAKEIMVTYNTEVLIYDGKNYYTAPLKPRNLTGRTGRGDTCFSAYITERLTKDIENSVKYAAAAVSLKMETPGPFKGTREDVEAYIKEFYDI